MLMPKSHRIALLFNAAINLTAHPYFNLNGGVADVGDHMLQIDADCYLETDAGGIPLSVAAVGGTRSTSGNRQRSGRG